MGSQAADPAGQGPYAGELAGELLAPSERERLIAAMAATWARDGYRELDVGDVTRRAGLPEAAFKRHFASKEACALAAVNEMLAEVTTVVSSAYSPRYTAWEVVMRAARSLLELLAARPSLAQVACVESRFGVPPAAQDLYRTGIRVLAALLDRVRAEAPEGADVPRPAIATRGALGSAEALIRRELRAGRAEHLPELLPDIVYGLLVPYLDQREALRFAGLAREFLNDGG